jgi:23S rRNA (uracil1939-C5)-methyltransferase
MTHQSVYLCVGTHATLAIDRLSLGGDGVGRLGNCVVFVPYGCPGDTLEVEITEVRKRFARAQLRRVITASPQRITPPCPYHYSPESKVLSPEFSKPASLRTQDSELRTRLCCGGCSWQHIVYAAQLDAKRRLVQETLERIGGLSGLSVLPTLGMAEPWRYRNKVQQPVGWNGREIVSGFYAPYSHILVPIEDCLVQPRLSVAILNRAKALLQHYRLQPYDEKRHRGWIRHLWVRTAQNESQAMLVFVTRTPDFPHVSEILETLVKEFPALVGIHQNVNPAKSNVILGRQWRKLCGAEVLEERLGVLRFQLSPESFFQVNTAQTEVLYDVVKAWAGTGKTLLDLYSGVGGIALWLAKNYRRVVGVEEVRSATEDAQRNARLNGIANVQFENAPAERFLARFHPGPDDRPLTVVLDPPRAGCAPTVLHTLVRLGTVNLIYVSCDPATLARDIAILVKGRYRLRQVQPVDLFPHTAHIETVVQLTKTSPES